MRSCRKQPEPLAWLFGLVLAFVLGLGTQSASAAEGEPTFRRGTLTLGDDAYLLDVDFNLELTGRLEEIVNHGVPLYFVLEFEAVRPRWYWLSEVDAQKTRTSRLAYHALTRQYRLYNGSLYQSFPSLRDALTVLSRVRSWPVAERNQLKPGETYQLGVRLRLDWAQLPKPFQITTVAGWEWTLGSEWRRWLILAPTAPGPVQDAK